MIGTLAAAAGVFAGTDIDDIALTGVVRRLGERGRPRP